jgi:CRISPR/Cas system CMR subunit Cmr6 (Cas7 group RAMP superfamily)
MVVEAGSGGNVDVLKLADCNTAHPLLVLHRVAIDGKSKEYGAVIDWFKGLVHPPEIRVELQARRERIVANWDGPAGVAVNLHVNGKLSRLMIGLGSDATPSGTGFPIEATTGLPVIPASGLRGAARRVLEPADANRLFGSAPEAEKLTQGSVNVLDGIPLWPVEFVHDVLTPHHASYYSEKGFPDGKDSPTPVGILSIKNAKFQAHVLPSSPGTPVEDLELAAKAIRTAADNLGLGAKTAAGYGYIYEDPAQ